MEIIRAFSFFIILAIITLKLSLIKEFDIKQKAFC